MHAETGQSYGSRRTAKQLQDEGCAVGRGNTRRLMKEEGISVQRRFSRRPQTTDSRHGDGVAPHRLERRCDVERPNVAWCGDITSLWTNDGWWYLSVLLDVYARKVVGWAMSDHIATPLVTNALKRAVGRRNPTPGLMHHSDRGAQYAAQAYRRLLSDDGIECSMSRKGD